ncbi:MAG: hypothetical protein GXO85_11335 [Chlorobi bacterium]|nr:hypothetical protein [Chlorobiota bacterium]
MNNEFWRLSEGIMKKALERISKKSTGAVSFETRQLKLIPSKIKGEFTGLEIRLIIDKNPNKGKKKNNGTRAKMVFEVPVSKDSLLTAGLNSVEVFDGHIRWELFEDYIMLKHCKNWGKDYRGISFFFYWLAQSVEGIGNIGDMQKVLILGSHGENIVYSDKPQKDLFTSAGRRSPLYNRFIRLCTDSNVYPLCSRIQAGSILKRLARLARYNQLKNDLKL